MPIVKCTPADCYKLALLNKQMIEEEDDNNAFSIERLEERIAELLNSSRYEAYFYLLNGETLGYALIRTDSTPKSLRQYFIYPGIRRRGQGRAFLFELMERLGDDIIDLEVLSKNKSVIKFWEDMGFAPRKLTMRYSKISAI